MSAGTVLGAGGTERQEVFLPTGLALALEAFSDRALRRGISLQKLPGDPAGPQHHAATWKGTGHPWLMGSGLVSQDGYDSGERDGDWGCGSETGMCFPPGPV